MPSSVASHRKKKQQQQAAQQQPPSSFSGHGDFSQAEQTKNGNTNKAILALLDLPPYVGVAAAPALFSGFPPFRGGYRRISELQFQVLFGLASAFESAGRAQRLLLSKVA